MAAADIPAERPRQTWRDPAHPALSILLVTLATWVVYANALTAPFSTWDDPLYVTANERTLDVAGQGLSRVWSADDAYAGRYIEYFPLRDSVYWGLHQLFGSDPLAFHTANVVAHTVAALLAWVLARRLGLAPLAALGAGLLFAVHPIHIESITWVSGLKDPMYFSLVAGAVLAWDAARRGRVGAYALSLVLLVLALLCKSLALVTPALFVLWELREPGGWSRDRLLRLAAALTPPALVVVLFTLQFLAIGRANHVVQSWHGGSVPVHVFVSAWAFVLYVAKSFAPMSFRLYYCFMAPYGWSDPRPLIAILTLVGYAAALLWSWRRQRLAFFLLGWFVVCLFPVMNVVPFPAIFADRYAYAPSFASCCAMALACARLRHAPAVLAAAVLALGGATMARNQVWHHEWVMWREVVGDAACSQNPIPIFKLGDACMLERRWADALRAYEKGIGHPLSASADRATRAGAHLSAARAARELRQFDVAATHARAAVTLDPTYDEAWSELWQAEWWSGHPERALASAEEAVRWNRDFLFNRWGRDLLRVELHADAEAARDLADVVARDLRYCASLAGWRDAHTPETAARRVVDAADAGRGCPARGGTR